MLKTAGFQGCSNWFINFWKDLLTHIGLSGFVMPLLQPVVRTGHMELLRYLSLASDGGMGQNDQEGLLVLGMMMNSVYQSKKLLTDNRGTNTRNEWFHCFLLNDKLQSWHSFPDL